MMIYEGGRVKCQLTSKMNSKSCEEYRCQRKESPKNCRGQCEEIIMRMSGRLIHSAVFEHQYVFMFVEARWAGIVYRC